MSSSDSFIDALTLDCRVLLAKFEEKQSIRFEAFCEVWKELKFDCIHLICESDHEKTVIIDYFYRILCRYLPPSLPLQYQVGAIYSLYAIYHSQPVELIPKVKIRMTMSMWIDLLSLQEKVKEQKHYDVYYIIASMKWDKVFLFVAMPVQLALGSQDAIMQFEKEENKGFKSNYTLHKTKEMLKDIIDIDNTYNSVKMKIFSTDKNEPILDPVTLKVTSPEFVQNLQQEVTEFEKWKENTKGSLKAKLINRPLEVGLPEDRKSDSEKQSESTSSAVDRYLLVKEIKDRSFKSIPQVAKHKRRYQPIPESSISSKSSRK
ncbi:snRNA-activating protein complex subunit 1-like isoform X1 [Xenia sp. Carnegie-2017]|uniref:snRNA-activating protein complex subunit 1-like isoform X1 n=1 Tax=Xenia sp. Carnegie-2017 TaxID=2897299 RepID=UPI001F035E2D|nr:snRNA-activating protein complex subunit 1-like isoform X1 [Xenia sp. Carnegie-2017]